MSPRNADVLALMDQTITIAPFVSNSVYGKPTHGTAVSYPCRVEHRQDSIRGADGRTLPVKTVAYVFPTTSDILPGATAQSKIVLPDGTSPPILATELYSYDDMNHEVIFCG